MIAISFELLAGRYHATGWDHHVNEGTVEWPPSPWRVLRAMLAAAYRADLPKDRVRALLLRLTDLPRYYLPPAAASHLRHYMPTGGDKTTKVFDAFYTFERPAEIVIAWPEVQLAPDQRALLASLLDHIPYLGRAESWSQAQICDHLPKSAILAEPVPSDSTSQHNARLLALKPPLEYVAWRDGYLAALDPNQRKRQPLPADIWEILHQDTTTLFKQGWSSPPGARWVDYRLSADPLAPSAASPSPLNLATTRPDFARYVLDSAVHLPVEKTLWVAEKLRAALLSHLGNIDRRHAPSLLGHDADQTPLTGHQHAYFLPEANPAGFIDHLTIYAPGGFDPHAVRALQSLRQLFGLTAHPTYTTLVALGTRDNLDNLPTIFQPSATWETLTPFIPPRCPKQRRGQLLDTPEQQLRWLCQQVLGHDPINIHLYPSEETRRRGLHHFRTARRRGAPVPGNAQPQAARLEFATKLPGPIALGYAAHYGLGLFKPIF